MNLELGARRRILVYGAGFIVLSLVQLTMTVGDYFLLPDFLFLIPLLAAMWTPGLPRASCAITRRGGVTGPECSRDFYWAF